MEKSSKSHADIGPPAKQTIDGKLIDVVASHLTLETSDLADGPLATSRVREFLVFDSAEILVNDQKVSLAELAGIPEGAPIQCTVQVFGAAGIVTEVSARI